MDRYVSIEVNVLIEKAMPPRAGVPKLLKQLGLSRQTQECFWVIAYDSLMNVRNVVEVARGGYARVNVHYPAVYAAVLQVGCDRFQIAHNHPNGEPSPTAKDISLTRQVMDGANACGLYLEDHVIVTPNTSSYSFADAGILIPAIYNGGIKEVAGRVRR